MATGSNDVMAQVMDALKGIRTEEGYRNTVALVTREALSFGQVGRFPALSVRVLRERVTSFPARRRRRVLRILVTGFVRPPAGADKFEAAGDLMADVDEALMGDPSLGGRAIFTQAREARMDGASHENGARASCLFEVVLHESV